MILNLKHFVVFVTILFLFSCKQAPPKLSQIEANLIQVDSTLAQIDSINSFVMPYRNRINQVLDSTLAYAPKVLTKEDGQYNSSAGNLMADIIFSEANPIFKKRTGKDIDFVFC